MIESERRLYAEAYRDAVRHVREMVKQVAGSRSRLAAIAVLEMEYANRELETWVQTGVGLPNPPDYEEIATAAAGIVASTRRRRGARRMRLREKLHPETKESLIPEWEP